MATVSAQKSSKSLLEIFNTTRERTLELVQTLEKDDFGIQTALYMSPPKWHLGHVSWLYEVVMSKTNTNYQFYSKEFSEYLNSYYQQFGTPHDKGERGIASRPTVDQILEYFEIITTRVREFINSGVDEKSKYLLTMAFHHECQHQELLTYDLQHLLADVYKPVKKIPRPQASQVEQKSISIKGGLYSMGYNGADYSYDIELPEHKVYLNDYKIDVYPITNGQYLKFIEDGGYENFKFWLSDGWEKVKENDWKAPMYWIKEDQWNVQDFVGKRVINPNEPVCHVSFYEAAAYCKWAGKRLPTEAEWEKACCWNEQKQTKTIFPWGDEEPKEPQANLLESHLWAQTEIGSYPDGKSSAGCQQMIGDVWEWTSSEFTGYPGVSSLLSST